MTDTEPVVVFKQRKRGGNRGTKRSISALQDKAEQDEPSNGPTVVKKARDRSKGLTQATTKLLNNIDSRKDDLIQDLAFGSSQSAAPSGTNDQMATATNIIDGEMAERLVAEQSKLALAKAAEEAGALGDGIYRGQAAYKQWREDPDKDKSKTSRVGPVASSAYARLSCRFDFQQDICKDWKDSGVCGYGDNCIYVHDRTDYKTGWQLEQEWQEKQKALAEGRAVADEKGEHYVGSDSEDDADALPSACGMCSAPFTEPVVTKCGHYFCKACARKRYLKKGKKDCAQCGAPTDGVFNVAHNLVKKMKRAQDEADEAARAAALAADD